MLDPLLNDDEYMLFADYESYIKCQDQIGAVYRDTDRWTRMAILNTARMGRFSSDRAIREYCDEIWHVKPVAVELRKLSEL
jgi:starch phosphorylase